MGIQGLTTALQRFKTPGTLSGESVVIDGPALVHRILFGCMVYRKKGGDLICQPPYALLGRVVIAWLDEFRRSNVTVRKIYFDGFLPPRKWPVRLERVAVASQLINQRVFDLVLGPSKAPADAFDHLKPELFLLTKNRGRSKGDNIPKPPFFIASVVETLKSHKFWGSLTHVVPGEADIYCAQDVRENGGTVLTGDSDLLMQDLGPGGAVSFFSDIDLVETHAGPVLVTHKFFPREISRQLEVSGTGGIPRIAYEKAVNSISWGDAIRQAQISNENLLSSEKFATFMVEHRMTHFLPESHRVLGVLSSLDPRVAELVIQSLIMEGVGLIPSDKNSRGPEALSMFLPIIVEDRTRKSAWTTNTLVRQMAYSILQICAKHRSQHVVEYRKLEPSSNHKGRQIEIPNEDDTMTACSDLVDLLEKLDLHFPLARDKWFAMASYQDVAWATSEGKRPLIVDAMLEAMRGSYDEDEHTWIMIHTTAQAQAAYYSFRMLRQVLDVFGHLESDPPLVLSRLHRSLHSLPLIAEWPTTDDIESFVLRLRPEGLSHITGILGVPTYDLSMSLKRESETRTSAVQEGKTRATSKRGQDKPKSKRSPGLNRFALLSQD